MRWYWHVLKRNNGDILRTFDFEVAGRSGHGGPEYDEEETSGRTYFSSSYGKAAKKKLMRSDAGCGSIKPASSVVIQNRQTSYSSKC